ncbi:GroES-like protein [Aspergillus heteromorphus CBS 117.55]|uniref:GroES-like protein n=1 Tax=Aspergillus heteromorphus CBS 117.55 TaxID=1448321 RepID=A0A317V1B5_9EURO|nr:GroES-like protein [Aspergillus heteromorphus CBS 117.55]PWY65980.1 GroES-like protein [Aspergillus heteromorphus CBS 117.55]
MKEVINLTGARTKIVDVPIPTFNDDQVLIKVIVSGSNPKDWKVPEMASRPEKPFGAVNEQMAQGFNQGDDIAGVVVEVGKNVVGFKQGDRVGAFHQMLTPGGSFAEYAVAWGHTTFHLPESTSFEEAATIPLAALTSAISLHHHLSLPLPWSPTAATTRQTPLVIYGASTAVGAFAIKFAAHSNIHPIIAIAGKGSTYVETLLDGSLGDKVIDYRHGADATIAAVKSALQPGGLAVRHALDTIVSEDSTAVLRGVIAPGGNINSVLPSAPDVSPGVPSVTYVSSAHQVGGADDCRELCGAFCSWFTGALGSGRFSGHPVQVKPGGLEGVQGAMEDLKEGRASAVKFVFRVGETPGLSG